MIARCLSVLPFLLQAADEIDPEAGEFNLFLFCLLVIALTAFCLLIAIGIVAGLLVAAAIAGVGFLGITSNAIISGLACKSPKVGLTVLTLQFGGLVGLVVGTAFCVATRWVLNSDPFDLVALLVCGALGIALGASMAWLSLSLIVSVFRKIREYCDSRLRKPVKSSGELPPPIMANAAALPPAADASRGGAVND